MTFPTRAGPAGPSPAGRPPAGAPLTGPPPAGPPPAGPLKRARVVARQLEREIVDAGWPVGRLVGTEPELLDRFGVGRGVLREAARLLEDHHVARMRRGRGGGLVVLEPDVRTVAEAVSIYLESLGVSLEDTFEARQVLDLSAVGLAADRVDERHSARLRALLEEEARADEIGFAGGSHRRIHAAIAAATGNPVIAVFSEALALLGNDQDAPGGPLTAAASRRAAASVHRAHEAIVEAVIGGDGLLASHRMLEHLTALQQALIHRPVRPSGPSDPSGRPRPEAGSVRAGFEAGSGLAGSEGGSALAGPALARRIRRDIARFGWPVGHHLGTETELLQRYRTGRAGLREAVRILEHHSVAEMRRGPGGGLVVRAPDGAAVLRAATRHLDYQGIRPVDLFEARDAVEMATLRLAVERIDDEGQRRLEAARERGANLQAADVVRSAHDFHVLIAELGGNRTLELFVAILTTMTAARRPAPGARLRSPSAARRQIDQAHAGIAEAILQGDTPLARRRMRLHLRALECSIG